MVFSLKNNAKKSNENQEQEHVNINNVNKIAKTTIKLYFRRWLVLFTFAALSLLSAFNWIEYNIIQDLVIYYYNQSLPGDSVAQNETVNWMSMIYMLTYIPFVFPAMFLLNRKGLKPCCAVGALLTSIGCWVKCGGVNPNRFAVAMTGQTLCGIGQAFLLGVPARLSSLWFGTSEISTATSIGVFGNQLGTALGFLIPPSVIVNNESKEMMTKRFYYLLFPVAGVSVILFILSITVIQNKPPTPSHLAQSGEDDIITFKRFKTSLIHLLKNRNFILLFISYGFNTGVYYSITTMLNQILLTYYKNENQNVGYIGLTLVLAGLLGTLIGGIILDRTKTFKWTTAAMYILSLVSMVVFTFTVNLNIGIVFATAFSIGFFMTGYLPVGFEFAAELTYPEPEGTSSGLLNASAQVFGIAFIYSQSRLITAVGILYSNIFLCGILLIGSIITVFIQSDLRRQKTLINNHNQIIKNASSTKL